jgi:DNA adenine methylase
MSVPIKAPFPWFGGKSKIAGEVWRRFGAVENYVEPFFGSGAVLLASPNPARIETANDINGWLTNFWRAVKADPDGVAEHADWPVSELDLHARGDWLFYRKGVIENFVERLRADPDYYDVKSAGWWVWGQSIWIGHGWGRELSHSGDNREGICRNIPRLSMGINRMSIGLCGYRSALSNRLRHVRVCCGNWARVVTPSVTSINGLTGVFLDPPYGVADRELRIYGENDSLVVSADVCRWCINNGDNPLLRIALCGYEGEHDMPKTWDVWAWKSNGGYANTGDGNDNRFRERVWFSPHCLHRGLFDELDGVAIQKDGTP